RFWLSPTSTPMEDSLYGTRIPIFTVDDTVGAMVGTAAGVAGGAAGVHATPRAAADPTAAAPARSNRRRDRLTCSRFRRTLDPTSWTSRSASTPAPSRTRTAS